MKSARLKGGGFNLSYGNKTFSNHFSNLILAASLMLSACGDKQDESVQKLVAVDPLSPRYESSLTEGIDFKKPGYPSFLIAASGVSGREDWGRWTDADVAPVVKFKFKKTLPGKFTLVLQANAIGGNVGSPVIIRAGNSERIIIVKNWPDQTVYEVNLSDIGTADTLEIIPPSPFSQKASGQGADDRKLGLGFISLKIKKSD